MNRKIKVAQFGLGPIGLNCLRLMRTKPSLEIVGACDIDPKKVGTDIGTLLEEKEWGMVVVKEASSWSGANLPEVVLHTTRSNFKDVLAELKELVSLGINIVSSTEDLLFPWFRYPELAKDLDELAQKRGVRVLGTGINPGFLMDTLAVSLTGVCWKVEEIWAKRVVDTRTRRRPLQAKTGSTMDPEEFRQLAKQGKRGHKGFIESAALIGDALGWKLDKIEETIEPIVAEEPVSSDYFQVEKGQTKGLYQVVSGSENGRKRVELELVMCLGSENPEDAIIVKGEPGVELRLVRGVAGDEATVGMLVNMIPLLLQAPPGLRKMTELAVPRFLNA